MVPSEQTVEPPTALGAIMGPSLREITTLMTRIGVALASKPSCARVRVAVLASVILVVAHLPAVADSVLTLNTSFIERYKNRVLIDTEYVVDKAHPRPNPPAKDADMHIAGRAKQIGLPTVAEIQNAAESPDAVDNVHQVEGSSTALKLSGVWRIWPEHGGEQEQIQGAPVAKITTTNPPHVFEIHPVTQISGKDLLPNLHPIDGFTTKDAGDAFSTYERTRTQIAPSDDGKTVTVTMSMAGYNYVEFIMRLNRRQLKAPDGEFVFATILDLDGETKVNNRRVVFVKGSAPEIRQQNMKSGECVHLLGIPRLDLALVSWRVRNAQQRPEVLTWNMPYEIVAVGLYDDDVSDKCSRE
jgi:hypothetical protein